MKVRKRSIRRETSPYTTLSITYPK